MSFFDDVKQAWVSADQNRLASLMRVDYSDENTWKAKAVDFLAASEEAQIKTVELFRLAKRVQEQLIGNRKLTWLLHIVPHLLNSYNGQDFDDHKWAAAAAADKLLPEPEWQDVQGWVHDWTQRLIKQAGNFRDNLGLFQQTAGASKHRPAVFHPFVLRVLHQHGIPIGTPFTAQELADWLLENTLIASTKGTSVSTGFSAGPAILKLSQMNLSQKMLTTFEKNCLCDEQAPAAWQGKEKEVQQLLDACPFWRETKLAASLRGLSFDRLKKAAGKIKIAAGTLPSFRNVMSDAARFPLPEFRSIRTETLFWEDRQFSRLTESLTQLEAKASEHETILKAAAEASKAASIGCHSFSSIARKPLCSAALPQLFSEMNLREYSVRLLLTQQLRSARTGTADNFPFEQSEFLADTPVWQKAVHGASPSGDNAATLASWLALEPCDGLRGKFMSADLADKEENEAKALWEQVHENEQFKLLIANPPPSTLPAAADLVPLRQKLAMLTLTGHGKWEELLNTLVMALRRLEGNSPSDAYRLFAAARLELSVTAAAAGHSPAAAVGGSNLADFNEFKRLLEVANAASQSALAWETRAGFNAVILLARFVELIGDLFFAKELQDRIGGIKGLIEESIKELRQGNVLPGADLPFALAASDLLRFARERGAGIAGELAAAPKWWPSDLAKLLEDLTAKFTDTAVLQQMALEGGLGFRLLLLAVMQIQLDHFERGRRLLARPPKEVEDKGFVGLNTLHGLHEAVRMAFCAEPLLRLGLHDEQDEDAPWWQPEYWFAKGSRPAEGQLLQTVNWLESWEDNNASLSQAQVNALGWAAWLGSRVPKRLPAGFDDAATYHAAVYSSDLLCDIDGRYPGELPYFTYNAVVGTLGVKIGNMRVAYEEFITALQQQRNDINTEEIKNLLKEPLRLNTSDFREQIQAALAEVRRAEAEIEAAEHESLAAEFEVIANQMLLDAAKLEMEREQKNIQVKELDAKISSIGVDIAKLDEQIADSGVEEKKNTVEKAKLVIEQTKLRKQQAQLDAIKLEIEFIRKIVGAEDPNNPGEYGIPVEINGETKIANGQMAAMAMRTKDILSKQIDRQIQEAKKSLEEALEAEEKARKKAKRNGLIKAACRFIGSVVGAIYGGPAGAALGAEIGEALAEMTIGIMDNKPPMDILTGLVDNAFSIASAAGFDLEKELNAMGSKAAGEISSCLKGFEDKFKPLLAEMPKVLDQGLLQDALEVLGLEELNNVSGLSEKLYEGIKNDIGNLGQIGTTLRNASGFETADQLTDHLKKHLASETTSLAFDDLKALAGRVGEQVEALTGADSTARREVLEKTVDKVAPLITGAIASKAGQIRQRVMKDWIGKKRGGNQFWNIPDVKEEGEKLLAHLFPENEKARADAAVNMALALLPPELYKGEIQKYLHPYQQNQDALIKKILDMPEPSGNGSEFWHNQLNHLNEAKKKFEEELFPFMEGKSLNNEPHPRTALLQELRGLESRADAELNAIEILTIQSDIDNLDLASAQVLLEQAEHELKKAGKFVQQAELHVQKESLLMQIAQVSLKKSDSMAQAEKAAKARAAAAKAKIKAAKAGLDAKLALWAGSRQRGVEAGRIRSGLDRPAVLLDIPRYRLNEARRAYANAFHSALEAYRELVRYCLATFFNEDGSNGAMALPKFIRPDMLTLADGIDSWSGAVTDWRDKLKKQMESPSGKLAVQFQAFHWDLTLEQIAALTSPSGLLLEIAPQIPSGHSLLDIPSHLVRKGKISQEAHGYLNAKGLAVTEQAEFIPVNDTDPAEPVLLWRLFDQAQYEVPVKLYDEAGEVLREVKVISSIDPRAYEVVRYAGSGSILQIRHWPYRHRGDRQQPKVGRSLPSDRYRYDIPPAHAKNGRIVALVVDLCDYPGEATMSDASFDLLVNFMGNHWQGQNSVQLQRAAPLSSFRITEVRKDKFVTDKLGLISLFGEMKTAVDGDVDLTNVQGTPVAGTTRIKFVLNQLPDDLKTVGSVRIAVLYKHYSV